MPKVLIRELYGNDSSSQTLFVKEDNQRNNKLSVVHNPNEERLAFNSLKHLFTVKSMSL